MKLSKLCCFFKTHIYITVSNVIAFFNKDYIKNEYISTKLVKQSTVNLALKKGLLLLCFFMLSAQSFASIYIPSKIKFADMQLIITRKAKVRINEKIDNLVKNKKYFDELVARVNLFMPIIEQILEQEGLPSDFKYQVIQESKLISDAFHSSATVGFWQFKHNTALEVGLNINDIVDDRMHLIESTKGAAKYLKIINGYLKNWLSTLLSYNRGRAEVERMGYKKYCGVKRMVIDDNTHWYIIHFLAHKLVFESHIYDKEQLCEIYLHEYKNGEGKTLAEIAKEFNIEEDQLKEYNKWAKDHTIPIYKKYSIIIPLPRKGEILMQQQAAPNKSNELISPIPPSFLTKQKYNYKQYINSSSEYPIISTKVRKKKETTLLNGLPGIIAHNGDTTESISQNENMPLKDFISFNEIDESHTIINGQVYYFKSKKSKAAIHFHIARHGETWWSISQKYGVTINSLMIKNRITDITTQPIPGMVIWMRFIRPTKTPVEYEKPDSV